MRLNAVERAAGNWVGEAVTEVLPRLYLDGTERSSLPAERFIELLLDYLTQAPPAWDPYDWQDSRDSA